MPMCNTTFKWLPIRSYNSYPRSNYDSYRRTPQLIQSVFHLKRHLRSLWNLGIQHTRRMQNIVYIRRLNLIGETFDGRNVSFTTELSREDVVSRSQTSPERHCPHNPIGVADKLVCTWYDYVNALATKAQVYRRLHGCRKEWTLHIRRNYISYSAFSGRDGHISPTKAYPLNK